ncbi:hypothetical protein AVEN_115105-1 [Araneus ventricosus]|uniref:Uncharacterized protein n=1 Tax=Araneus ventricosus TaxID=182803 RepID=A0A4Y1ZY34_ARAVE|nr:hypothetical protein AVEN_115105-1 [Araneus ventricosus]
MFYTDLAPGLGPPTLLFKEYSSVFSSLKLPWISPILITTEYLWDSLDLLEKGKKNMFDCNMSIKAHFRYSQLDMFPKNLYVISDEQEEQFRQDLKVMKGRCQDRLDEYLLADCCCSIRRDCQLIGYSRKS